MSSYRAWTVLLLWLVASGCSGTDQGESKDSIIPNSDIVGEAIGGLDTQPEPDLSQELTDKPDGTGTDILVDAVDSTSELTVELDSGSWPDGLLSDIDAQDSLEDNLTDAIDDTQDSLEDSTDATVDVTTPQDSSPQDVAPPDDTKPEDVIPDLPLEEQQSAEPVMSSKVIRKAKYDEPLQVTCRTVNGLGEVIPNPGSYEVTFSALDVQETPDGFLFPTAGTFTVTCQDGDNNISGTTEFVVTHELVAPSVAAISSRLSTQRTAVENAIGAAASDDGAALTAALETLSQARFEAASQPSDITLTPPGGWPSVQELEAKVESSLDDASYFAAVSDLAQQMVILNSAIQQLATNPSLDAIGAVETVTEDVEEAFSIVAGLDPGALGYLNAMPMWKSVVEEVQKAQSGYGEQLEIMFASPEDFGGEPCPNCFTLGELVVSMAIQYTLSQLPTYTGLLKEAGKAAASMAVMLMVSDAIEASMPPGPNAPELQYNLAGYSNAVNDGAALTMLVAGFDDFPGNNVVLFIGPGIGDTVVNVVDLALSTMSALKNLGNWENVFELGGAIVDTYNALNGDIELMAEDIPSLLSTGVVPLKVLSVDDFFEPGSGEWDQIISLSPLPEVNGGWMPKVGILVPIVFSRGNGPTYEIVILP